MTEQEAVNLVSANGWAIADVPQDVRTDQVCIAAIRNNWQVFFNSIGAGNRTKPVSSVAVNIDGGVLQYVPDGVIDEEICFAAVNQSAMALKWVPPRHMSPKLCELAVAKDAWAIEHVPPQHQSKEICEAFTRMDDFDLSRISERNRSMALCMAAVKADFMVHVAVAPPDSPRQEKRYRQLSFWHVPESLFDQFSEPLASNMCWLAVCTSPHCLAKIPIKFRDERICRQAVKTDGSLLGEVPEEKRTPELCKIATENYWWAIRYVPKQCQTADLCLDVFEENGVPFSLIPDALKTSDLCHAAVKRNYESIKHVPDNIRTPEIELIKSCEMALIAIKGDWNNYRYVPLHLQSADMWLAAATQDGFTLEITPEQYKSQDVCFESMTRNKEAYNFIPNEIKKSDLFKNRIRNFYNELIDQSAWGQYDLYLVHPEFLTYELYLKAIRIDPFTITEVIRLDYHTPELCKASFREPYDTDEMLDDCPKALFTPNLCAAVAEYGTNYNFICIPDELKTHDLCKIFVSRNGLNLENIPDRYCRNVEICQIAVDNNPRAMDFVPEDIRSRIVVKRES